MNSSFIISEIFSSSFHPPKHNWADGTITGISYSPMNILLGQNASIEQHVVKRGNKPLFENIIARIAARNRVGLSAYTDSLQSNGLRIQPLSIVTRAIPAIVSFSVLTISQSQLGIFYSVPKSKGKDIDNLNVERTSSANIRIRREIELGINCNELNDVSGSFRFFFHGQCIDCLEASDFLQVH